VKDIEESFEKGIQELDNMKAHIKELSSKTNKLVGLVKNDYRNLLDINTHLTDANNLARAVVNQSFNVYFEPFKASLTKLNALCESFLKENPLLNLLN